MGFSRQEYWSVCISQSLGNPKLGDFQDLPTSPTQVGVPAETRRSTCRRGPRGVSPASLPDPYPTHCQVLASDPQVPGSTAIVEHFRHFSDQPVDLKHFLKQYRAGVPQGPLCPRCGVEVTPLNPHTSGKTRRFLTQLHKWPVTSRTTREARGVPYSRKDEA